ncbi:uncharacterized protein Z520_11043 [Fonsecaea multimorphosa CBS 102226]|uniref:DUF6590 domain-containing protein n=1 Tax=Fonsecaea multimorphosa CBS 102226 TaxID=1442371 RepID=A0A0D2JRW5_9EURO|nr:uncharacterized protein Z520_11043 [Fonsecaea multimorphosa CBS 102226]KIX93189.1 hypothetical protein Z520_11043 [Fonsecaea multimorphosa CBS 102226]OAL18427.1 hypothetical protein AYO22_10623 [Fonsecaea multimorphosa]
MPDQPKSLPIRGDRRSNGRAAGRNNDDPRNDGQVPAQRRPDAPRSTPQIVPQPAQARFTVADQHQRPSIASNPIFPQERTSRGYEIAPGEQQSPRVSHPNAPGASSFNSSLDLLLRGFANIPKGDFENVATYLRANPSVLRQEAQALRTEAIHAYRYASRGSEVKYSGKAMYGDSCIQQYVILKQLQHIRQKLIEARHPKRVTTEEVDETINRFFDQLLDKASSTRKQLYEEVDKARVDAKRQLQSAGHGPLTTTSSPQQPQTPMTTSYTVNQAHLAQQGSFSTTASHETSPPSLALLSLRSSGGDDESRPRQPGPTTQIPRGENATAALDSRYVTRPSAYYQPGRVFAMLWHEPYNEGSGNTGNDSRHSYLSEHVSIGPYGQLIYTSIRRMVVVRQGHGCSVCIHISTYGKRGLAKFKRSPTDIDAHSIIYMDDTEPQHQPGEPRSNKIPIAVKKASPDQRLNPWSRLCYSQPQTVQHTVKTLDVGWVTKDCLPYLLSYFQRVNALP